MTSIRKLSAILLAVVCCFLLPNIGFATDYPVENAVVIKEARVRKKPAQNSAKVTTLKVKSVLTITGESEDKNGDIWYAVETKDGKTGYIRSDFIELPKSTYTGPIITKEMTVEVAAKCKSRNHVGSAWSKKCYFSDIELSEDKNDLSVVSVTSGETMTVRSTLTEHDKNPDKGSKTTEYIPTDTELLEGFSITHEVKVKENSGKYRGYAATWSVTYTFSPIPDSVE